MTIVLAIFTLLQSSTSADDGSYGVALNGDPAYYTSPNSFQVLTRVFNAYPNINVSAFVFFEEERVSRLLYEDLAVLNVTLEAHSDFLIQFKQIPKEGQMQTLPTWLTVCLEL